MKDCGTVLRVANCLLSQIMVFISDFKFCLNFKETYPYFVFFLHHRIKTHFHYCTAKQFNAILNESKDGISIPQINSVSQTRFTYKAV